MSIELKERASAYDRNLRQRAANYLKSAEKLALRLMEFAYDRKASAILRRLDQLKSGITQAKSEIEYGSFVTLPPFRSGRRLLAEVPTKISEEMSQSILIGELTLLECRNLFENLQDMERAFEKDEKEADEMLSRARESLRKIEELKLSRSQPAGEALNTLTSKYEKDDERLKSLSEKENLLDLERVQLAGLVDVEKGSPFSRFLSFITRKPVFHEEIGDAILFISGKVKAQTGGIIKLSDLYLMVKRIRPLIEITLDDTEKVVSDLQKQGIIPGLRLISGIKIVELIPVTMTPDQHIILEMASEKGTLTLEEVLMKTEWTPERASRALKGMEEIGIAKYDLPERRWIFPAFMKEYKFE